ncbi:hypothetical protein SAMN05216328_15325 [Ensifer sp. YR511]|nr:hypothetical protein SAMN05216328_15325 [Ensifer sp. YR511]
MANPEDTPKGQHFLLSPECRTLTVLDLARMRDTTAYNWFKRLCWHETEDEPYCPKVRNAALPHDEPQPLQMHREDL